MSPPLSIVVGKQRIAKVFDDKELYFGTVTKYYGPEDDLWNISYDDGDAEDMNREELCEAIQLFDKRQQESSLDDEKKKPPPRRVTLSPTSSDDKQDDEQENSDGGTEGQDNAGDEGDAKPVSLPPFVIGKQRIAKIFDDELYFGTVIKHFESEETDATDELWKVSYDDGDSEDLNRRELFQAIELYKRNESDDDTKLPANNRRVTLSPPSNDNVEMEASEDEGSDESVRSSARKRQFLSSDEEEDESDSEEEATPERLGKIKSRKARKKYARLEQQAWLGGGDDEFSGSEDSDDDDELEAEEGFHRSELEFAPTDRRKSLDFGTPPPPPVALTQAQQQDMLAAIEKPADKALQKLLINEAFQFQLLPHQFLAVRKIAGVPGKFPLHHGSQVTAPEEATMVDAMKGLNLDVNKCNTKGVLVADDMGLGKTVEAIAGAILRNAMTAARKDKPRPTLIVSPNDAVQVQWRDTLVKNGVLLEDIHGFEVGQHSRDFDKAIFLLMTRYVLQGEVKRVFHSLEAATNKDEAEHLATSALFPHADADNLERLKVQYLDENTKIHVVNEYRYEDESVTDCVTRLVNLCTLRMRRKPEQAEPIFETFIIDEAHFLKNITTLWGMGAALISTHSYRTTPLTGTPYNNGPADLAAMMTFIDAAKSSAHKGFWASATSDFAAADIRNRISQWHAEYIVRRRKQDVLTDLVQKTVESRLVRLFAAEQTVYNHYEQKLEPVLKQFSELLPYRDNPAVRKQLKELGSIALAIMSSLRAANIHAMLPGGREYTKQFSPTRQHLRSIEERPKACVCCDQNMRPSIPVPRAQDDDGDGDKRRKRRRHIRGGTANVDEMEEFKETDDDAMEMYEEEEEEELVPLPCSLCEARSGPVSHFAHQECLDTMKLSGSSCPRCKHAKIATQCELPDEGNRRYCTRIAGGFVGSSKINSIVDWYQNEVPADDKVLILSFYKGGLDLLEGIFCHDLGVDCARFDGDLPSIAELERFKKDPDCKILLASVQSGGVGLNIVEANHVAFCDRWYNPFVHQQAEDRCHRIGQTKDVRALYFDAAATIDEAMVQMNKLKLENSAILLADGLEIGHQQGSVSYQDLSGVLNNLLAVIRSHRMGWLEMTPGNMHLPIPAVPEAIISAALKGKIAENLVKAAAARLEGSAERGDDKSKKRIDYAKATGTEDVIVVDDEEEHEF